MGKCVDIEGFLIAAAGVREEVIEEILVKHYGMDPEDAREKAAEVVECVTKYGEFNEVQLINSIQELANAVESEKEFWEVLRKVFTPAALLRYNNLLRDQGIDLLKPHIVPPQEPKRKTV